MSMLFYCNCKQSNCRLIYKSKSNSYIKLLFIMLSIALSSKYV